MAHLGRAMPSSCTKRRSPRRPASGPLRRPLPERHKRNERERRTHDRHVNRQDRTGDTLTLDVTGPIVVRVGPPHRHAMPVLSPIESCSRARSSGVECPKTTHMNSTVAISTNIKVSTPRIAPSRCPCAPGPSGSAGRAGVARVERAAPVSLGRGFGRSGRSASLASPELASLRVRLRIATRDREPEVATLDAASPHAQHVALLFVSAIRQIDVDWKEQAAFQAGQS